MFESESELFLLLPFAFQPELAEDDVDAGELGEASSAHEPLRRRFHKSWKDDM